MFGMGSMEDELFKALDFLGKVGGGKKGMKLDLNAITSQVILDTLKLLHKQLGEAISMMEKPGFDPFEVLGVSPHATRGEVNDAYKRKAKVHHPDMAGGDAQKMAELNLARELIFKLRGWK